MKTNKFTVIAVVVALILSAAALYKTIGGPQESLVGATPGSLLIEQYSPYVQQNGGISSALPIQTTSTVTAGNLTVGTSGTNFSFIGAGSCTLGTLGPTSINTSQPATTTRVYDCPFTGVQAGDVITASIATSTVMGSQGWSVPFSKASTTSGYIEVGVANNTGTANVPSASAVGSSTVVRVFRPN